MTPQCDCACGKTHGEVELLQVLLLCILRRLYLSVVTDASQTQLLPPRRKQLCLLCLRQAPKLPLLIELSWGQSHMSTTEMAGSMRLIHRGRILHMHSSSLTTLISMLLLRGPWLCLFDSRSQGGTLIML